MPGIPANITIAGRIPATIKGNLPPLINTLASARGGFRTGGDPVVPVVPDDPIDPVNPIAPSVWEARLAKTGSGTPDPTFDPSTDVTYIGAFRIPHFGNGVTSTTAKSAIAYKPPEAGGRNGPNGSLFFGGAGFKETFEGVDYPIGAVAEVQIPDFSTSTDYLQLPPTTVLQNFVNIYRRAPILGDLDTEKSSNSVGAITLVGNKAYFTMFEYYADSGADPNNLLICDDVRDLANSSYQGFLTKAQMDHGAKYTMQIPAEHQAGFNGATHLNGVFASLSIIGRSSFGPALVSWTPSNIQPGDTTVPDVREAFYGSDPAHSIEGWDYQNEAVEFYYEAVLGVASVKGYLNSDPSTRLTSFDGLPLPDPSIYATSGTDTQIQCAFIPPGTNTVMLIGNHPGVRYGTGYKGYTIEEGTDRSASAGYYSFSKLDKSNFFWTLNLNDVKTSVNAYDPGLIQSGIFDSNRWQDLISGYRSTGVVISGTFDPILKRLYVVQANFIDSEYSDQHVVSVYQIGGGE